MGDYETVEEFRNKVIGFSRNAIDGDEFDFVDTWEWEDFFVSQIDGENYMIMVATHKAPLGVEETTIPSLLQLYVNKECGNEEVEKVDGNKNGKYDVLVLSQAVQTAGFDDAATALNEAFPMGDNNANVPSWFIGWTEDDIGSPSNDGVNDKNDTNDPPVFSTKVTPDNINSVDFTQDGRTYEFNGAFDDLDITELGDDSVLKFDDAEIKNLILGDDAVITGKAKVDGIKVERNSTDPIELTLDMAMLEIAGEVSVMNAEGKSILNITNSDIDAGNIFVGGHTMNAPAAMAEFNVENSYLSCEENSLGSTIAIWGKSGVDAKIADSEVHTYSRGWHQSEDANDNSITFQGGDHINVDIERSNMHLYGARSIINARTYYDDNATVDFSIDESLIWVVTKSSHADETLPVWNATEITDSVLVFTKGAYAPTTVVKSFVYGNPVIHGNYNVTTQCGWATDIILSDNQTLTIVKDAQVSVYDGAEKVNFVLNDNAMVVVEAGATLTNIDVVAGEGYTLNTTSNNGNTVYTVSAN